MKSVGAQLQRSLKALSELYQADPVLAGRIGQAVGASLHMMALSPGQPGALTTIEWPSEPNNTKTANKEH